MSALQQMLLAGGPPPKAYATLNPSDKSASVILSNGNLRATTGDYPTAYGFARSTIGKTSGKWYWEVYPKAGGGGDYWRIGLGELSVTTAEGNTTGTGRSFGYAQDKMTWYGGGGTGTLWLSAYGDGDVVSIALDCDTSEFIFRVNNVVIGSYTWSSYLTPPLFAMVSGLNWNNYLDVNFGATPFVYTPPAGFNAGLYE